MTRQYKGRTIELLAPVGTFADFQMVIKSAADAVYLGGKKFNMRMHNPAHNLTNEEIAAAVQIAHGLGKKVYVTFNNMMTAAELSDAKEYLIFLETAEVDALIIQDFGAVALIKSLGLKLELHLSVMANVHNEEMLASAKELGVTRCVISREASLADVHRFVRDYPELEYEYFIHGDMCIAHGAQCYASGVFFGKSGNRGLCMKPCRWAYQGKEEPVYPMAVKDMSLYQHIPELIFSGVNSYKIEGRMRSSEYLIDVINLYGTAIDRYLADPTAYETDPAGVHYLEENRVRDLSTAYALKKPGQQNIAFDGKREPRIFSRPQEEPQIRQKRIETILTNWALPQRAATAEIRVTVDHKKAALAALSAGIDALYLSGEVLRPYKPFTRNDIKEICATAESVPVFYILPRMTDDKQLAEQDELIAVLAELGATGIVCGNLGQFHRYRRCGLRLRGDYGLNIYNPASAAFYSEQGAESVTISIELPAKELARVLPQMTVPAEVIVQGLPTLMYMEHSFYHAQKQLTGDDWLAEGTRHQGNLDMVDEKGLIRKIREDQNGRNHLLPTKEFSYAPLVPEICQLGAAALRIEAKEYTAEQLTGVIAIYRALLGKTSALTERMAAVSALEVVTARAQSLQTLVFD